MNEWWQGFAIGAAAMAGLGLAYLVLSIAAMTLYRVWIQPERRLDDHP